MGRISLSAKAAAEALAPDADAVDRLLGPVRRIAVFRALNLGDMICATPALRALRQRFPLAFITLVGLPWAAAWARRLSTVDRFVAFPGYPGLPERRPDTTAWRGFVASMRLRAFDLMVQLHGSGGITNPMLATLGARHLMAFHDPSETSAGDSAITLGRIWPCKGTETERLLQLIDVFGVHPDTRERIGRMTLEFPLRPGDRAEAQALLRTAMRGSCSSRRHVCVHAGAQLPSRRWPVQRFAQVADALAATGHTVVLTGVAAEAELAATLQATMRRPCINLVGQTSLWSLGALIESASLLVSNDTGVSHVAAALGTPSVVVSCGAEVPRWAPSNIARHKVLWADAPCRPCAAPVCPYGHVCANAVDAGSVTHTALSLLAAR